jgi:hypothetical protein
MPTTLKKTVFVMILATKEVLRQLLSDSLLVFAPGLLDVFQATILPSGTYFKSLPIYVTKCWAVHFLVLEKPGFLPKIYIASGTDSPRGSAARFYQYDIKAHITQYFRQALDDGYTIVHRGLLCWSLIPTATEKFPIRALFVAIEATFSFALSAMKSRTEDCGMPHLCLVSAPGPAKTWSMMVVACSHST